MLLSILKNIISLGEYIMEKKKSLEKVGFGIAIMFGIYWIYTLFIQDRLNLAPIFLTLIGFLTLYAAGLLLFTGVIKKIPNSELKKGRVSGKTLAVCFFLQFTALIIAGMLTNILALISGQEITNDMEMLSPLMLFLLLIFNPIVEEFVFRKLFADKLLQYGELFYMLVSSFCFAIVHGVAIGIPQVVYTFLLGMIWSYLTVKTGSIKISVILHALSNLFGGIIIQLLQGISMEAVGIYSIFMMLSSMTGIILFLTSKKNISIDGQSRLVDKGVLKDMFTNKGILFYAVLTIVMMTVKHLI